MWAKNVKLKRIIFWSTLTITVTAVIITVIIFNSTPLKPCINSTTSYRPQVIVDAGHGGIDGGATSASGTAEADINLDISIKTRDIMKLLGVNVIMTRSDHNSLDYNESKSIRDNKNSDLKARLKLASDNPGHDFLSIHLNKFEQSKSYGAQVFYSKNNPASKIIAERIQQAFVSYIDSTNKRISKQSHDSIYLMKHINSPAVIIECGFLSNPEEERLLMTDRYRTQIALAITKGYLDYIKER
jgi:N-acetylmuramoyl-L-alanine amidase